MKKTDFPLSLIPKELQKKIIYKEYINKSLILSSDQNKIIYLISGYAHIVRYEESGEHIYPYVFSDDEFIGTKNFVSNPQPIWDVIANTGKAYGYEIPPEIFDKYILPSPIFINHYLLKISKIFSQGNKAYYIYFKGGAMAHFAFILDYAFSVYGVFTIDKYSNLTRLISASKASLYNFTNELIERKIIKKERSSLILLDKKKLRGYFEHYLVQNI